MAEGFVALTVNGSIQGVWVRESATLLQVLREVLGLTGTKNGCETGQCGSCTIWIDGAPRLACLTPVGLAAGSQITTVEGLGAWWQESHPSSPYHPLQTAFVEFGAVQCGFCTPGMLMAAAALLRDVKFPTVEEIRERLAGHLCRCTGYEQIVRAIREAAVAEVKEL